MEDRDITQELNKLRNDRSQIFESSLQGFCLIDTNLVITDVNNTFCKIFGLNKEQLIGKLCSDVYGGDLCYSNRCPVRLINEGKKSHLVERLIDRCNGLKTPYIVSARPYYDLNGQLMGIIQEISDVSERNQANEKISQLAAIVESANDGIFSCSLDGKISYWNKGAELIYGYSAAEIQGQNILDLIPPKKSSQMMRLLAMLSKGKAVNQYELLLRNKDQKLRNICFSASPVLNSLGEITSISVITKDVTELKRMEKEMSRIDRLNLVGQMAAGIGHEIRNPMTTVRGFLQLLANKETDDRKNEYYDIIIEELDRANEIITEFLSLAKSRVVNLQIASLNNIINALYPLMASDAMKQDKRIILDKGDIPNIPLNEKEIRQLIINLVRNGLEASPSDGIVTIGTYTEHEQVVLYVEDKGCGIPPDILEKLGTPFITTKDEGIGLGLSVCYSIADKHNAKIDVKTGSQGTTFYVRFKVKQKRAKK